MDAIEREEQEIESQRYAAATQDVGSDGSEARHAENILSFLTHRIEDAERRRAQSPGSFDDDRDTGSSGARSSLAAAASSLLGDALRRQQQDDSRLAEVESHIAAMETGVHSIEGKLEQVLAASRAPGAGSDGEQASHAPGMDPDTLERISGLEERFDQLLGHFYEKANASTDVAPSAHPDMHDKTIPSAVLAPSRDVAATAGAGSLPLGAANIQLPQVAPALQQFQGLGEDVASQLAAAYTAATVPQQQVFLQQAWPPPQWLQQQQQAQAVQPLQPQQMALLQQQQQLQQQPQLLPPLQPLPEPTWQQAVDARPTAGFFAA